MAINFATPNGRRTPYDTALDLAMRGNGQRSRKMGTGHAGNPFESAVENARQLREASSPQQHPAQQYGPETGIVPPNLRNPPPAPTPASGFNPQTPVAPSPVVSSPQGRQRAVTPGDPTRPQLQDYWDTTAYRWNQADTPFKGQITREDVQNYQAFNEARVAAGLPGYSNPTQWLSEGRPAFHAPAPSGATGTPWGALPADLGALPAGWNFVDPAKKRVRFENGRAVGYGPAGTTTTPTMPGAPPAGGAGGGAPVPTPSTPFLAGPATGSPAAPGAATTPPGMPAAPVLGNFDEQLERTIREVTGRYSPMFERQQEDLARKLLHVGGVTGAANSGGFTETLGSSMNELTGQQNAQLGEQISTLTQSSQKLAMDKYVAELSAAVQTEGIRTNADLERKAQELQKYGIDKNDLLERYKAELAKSGIMYSADRGVDAAKLQAAAQSAAANASAAASRYNADRDYQLGLIGMDVTRENNIFRGLIDIAALGGDWAKWVMASDPFSILTGSQTPGDVVIKP